MGPSRAIATVAIAAACSGIACSLITHAYDYQVGTEPDAAPDSGPPFPDPCGSCADHPDFARATCVGEAGSTNPSAATRYYGVDSVLLGTHGTTDPAYSVGINQDCADRPDGSPARCAPRTPAVTPFATLPHGIENAFATQLLAPMEQRFPAAGDVEARVNAWIASGAGGLVVSVDGWDGQTDGPVRVRILQMTATRDVVDQTSASAQVVGGKLTAVFDPSAQVFIVLGDLNRALLSLEVAGARVSGTITDSTITNLLITGYLETNGQLGPTFEQNFTELLLGCADGGSSATSQLDGLLSAAYDLPDPGNGCTTVSCGLCAHMSFGLAAHATRLAAAPSQSMGTSCLRPDSGAAPDAGDASTSDVTTD